MFDTSDASIQAPANAIHGDDGSITLRLVNGAKIRIAAPPKLITGDLGPRRAVSAAIATVNDLADKTISATRDPNLSDLGKQTALHPLRKGAAFMLGQLWVEQSKARRAVQAREDRLYAIEPPNLTLPGHAIRQMEIRQWFASLPTDQKAAAMDRIRTAPGESVEMVQALLTSPYAMVDVETSVVRELWQTVRREQNPTEAEAIDADRESIDWSESQLGVLGRVVVELSSAFGQPDFAREFAEAEKNMKIASGFQVLGISNSDMRAAQRIAAAQPEAIAA